jgi:Fe-S cluster assembly iron-binding protein IscA
VSISITIAPEAEEQLSAELQGALLRISFTTGCGGSGYRLASAAEPIEGDILVRAGSVQLALDEMAARNLDGAVIVSDELEGGFSIEHPAAVAAVWCG